MAWSLSGRLTAVLVIALTGLWIVAAVAFALVMRHELNEAFDSGLQQTVNRLLPLAVGETAETVDGGPPIHNDSYMLYQVRAPDGHVLGHEPGGSGVPFPVPPVAGFFEAAGLRIYGAATPNGTVVQVAEPLDHRTEAITEGLIWLLVPLLILIPASGAVIRWAVRQSIRPIAQVREELHQRGGANTLPLPQDALPAELTPIIEDVNHLLTRLGRALAGEREFASNSAHGLRTPVAAALAQAQVLADRVTGTSHATRAQHMVETLRHLARLIEKLLQLSRAEGALALSRDAADLRPVLRLLVDEYGRRADVAGRLRFEDEPLAELTARTDIDAFGIAFRNLIDNALVHSPAGTPVTVAVAADRTIRVVNEGPPVPARVLATLATRYERGRATTAGTGLGLAIVDAIMRQSGGALTLRSPATGRPDGFEAVLAFPR
jgi:two-component system OmpR family sensor kinase